VRPLFLITVAAFLTGCASRTPAEVGVVSGPDATTAVSIAFTEGPTADSEGNVYFSDVAGNRILKYSPKDKAFSVFRADSNRTNGLMFDADFRLIACEGSDAQRSSPRVTRTDMKTGKVEVLTDRYEGKKYNAPNDVTMDGRGNLYFTDPVPDSTSPTPVDSSGSVGTPGVYRIDTAGKVTRLLAGPDTEWPNGLTVSPDDKTLYLVEANKVETGTRAIRAFDLSENGELTHKRTLYNFYPGRSADGISIDSQGNVYAAAGLHRLRGTKETLDTKTGIHVISPAGKLISFTPVPEDTITNCAFGGPDLKTLYVTAGKTLFQIHYDVAGLRR